MNTRKAVFMAVLVMAVVALALPLTVLRARAAGYAGEPRVATSVSKARTTAIAETAAATRQQQEIAVETSQAGGPQAGGRISAETLNALGFKKAKGNVSEKIARMLTKKKAKGGGEVSIQSGQPTVLNARSALSAALMTHIGGRDNQFSEVTLIADWDGREDCAADREQKVDDFSFAELEIDGELTRTGISEHTVANGFLENVYYYGDSVGNLWVGTDTNPGVNTTSNGAIDSLLQVNIPTLVNTGAPGAVPL